MKEISQIINGKRVIVKKPELLAPAGNLEKLKVAILYGADAVYCGTSSLSLRTRADMGNDDLVNTIKYAHSIGKKVYVTLNIFAWDEKYSESGIGDEITVFMQERTKALYKGCLEDILFFIKYKSPSEIVLQKTMLAVELLKQKVAE